MLPTPSLSGAYNSSAVHKNPGKIPASIFPSRQCFREDNTAWHREVLPHLQLPPCTTSFALTGQLRDEYTLQNLVPCFILDVCLYTLYHDFFILQHFGVVRTGRMLFIV